MSDLLAAIALLTAVAHDLHLPPALTVGTGWGESNLDWNARNPRSGAAGLIQVTPQHGGPPERWMGEAGAVASLAHMRARWAQAARFAPSPDEWARYSFDQRVDAFARWWIAAQGPDALEVWERAADVLRETEAILAEGEGQTMVTKPMMQWFPAHLNNFTAGRPEGVVWEGVTIHTTDGGASLEALGAWFQNPNAEGSTHFGVGPDGRIGQFVSLQNTAHAHGILQSPTAQVVLDNGDLSPNTYLIGIEHVDGGTPGTVTKEQLEASARLCAWLFASEILPHAARTGAAVNRERIIGHYEITARDRARCPSWPAERFEAYIARVREHLAGPVEPPPIDYKAGWIAELQGVLAAAEDDATRAAVRIADARRKLAELGA